MLLKRPQISQITQILIDFVASDGLNRLFHAPIVASATIIKINLRNRNNAQP